MNRTSSFPLFPLEICKLIIEELVGDPDYLPEDVGIFKAVKQCSYVSRSFNALCQPYIFRVISAIRINDGAKRRTKDFMHIMKSNPNLSRYVRHLCVETSDSQQFTLSKDAVSEVMEVLKGFPNLIKLNIQNYRHRHPGYTEIRNLPQYVCDDLCSLVNLYIYQGKLRYLTMLGLDDWPVQDVFSCSTITKLGLGSSIMPSLTISASYITQLEIQDPTEQFDLGALCFFPSLEELFLAASCFVSQRCENAPSFDLQLLVLSIERSEQAAQLLEFYSGYAKMTGVHPFGKLEELEYSSSDDNDVEAVERILQTTIFLKVLTIESRSGGRYLGDKTFPLALLELSSKIIDVFPHLTTLKLEIHVKEESDYNKLMSEIADIFVDIEGKNVIEDVTISLDAEAYTFHSFPSCESWSRISRSLSSCTSYPKLKAVKSTLCMIFIQRREPLDWIRSSSRNVFMSRAMKELVDRKGVKFQGRFRVTESRE